MKPSTPKSPRTAPKSPGAKSLKSLSLTSQYVDKMGKGGSMGVGNATDKNASAAPSTGAPKMLLKPVTGKK